MKSAILTLLFLGLAGSQAMAFPRGTKFATLQVVNRCDEAVQVTVENWGSLVLEPNASQSYSFYGKGKLNPTVTASLVSDSSISDSDRCQLKDGATTIATIDCNTTASAISLDVNCLKPGKSLAFLDRESAVALASTGGLGFLLLLGMLLGRAPRRRGSLTQGNVDSRQSEPSADDDA